MATVKPFRALRPQAAAAAEFASLPYDVMDAAEGKKNSEKVRLNISTRRTGKFARVQFSDNAGGIPKSRLSRIFEPFYTTKGEKNRGLGLFIARKIISEHNGAIRVVSRKPFTRVTIDIPLLQ